MKRLGSIWGAALLLMLGIGMLFAPNAAKAQDTTTAELAQNWSIRIGVYIYQSQTTRGQNGELGFSGVVERTVYHGLWYDVTVGIGYNGWDSVYSIPIEVSAIAHKANLRYGAGAGYSFGKRLDGQGTNGTVLSVLLGYQMSRSKSPLSVDLRYYFIGGSDNELDGLGVTIGGQF